VGFFNWSAPLMHRFGQRWTAQDADQIAGWLAPHMTEGGPVLDLGGGSGGLATRLADRMKHPVTVLDPTPELLARLPARPDVTGVLGAAEEMPFSDDAFDALVVTDAFHHFAQQDAAAREMRRVVRCGGGVLVIEIDPSGWTRALVWGERLLGEPGAFMTPAQMCAFMSGHGIEGQCVKTAGTGYRFLGVVQP
jgi:ubiquinone/menaquinone biosynthesis C-methylase UbiE